VIHHDQAGVQLRLGDILDSATLADIGDGSVQTIVTSPPYFGLRDYGVEGQLGAEESVQEYVDRMVAVFAGCKRVLADDGALWLNLGDSYSTGTGATRNADFNERTGGKPGARKQERSVKGRGPLQGIAPKNLLGVPWRVALALQVDGWILRSEVIWSKPNAMPESVKDRPTRAHEHVFLLVKSSAYFYDAEAIATEYEGDRSATRRARSGNVTKENSVASAWSADAAEVSRANKRTVWEVPTQPFPGSHFAVYPPELIRPCIRATSRVGDIVMDPFSGSGTTGMVAREEGRRYIGVDLNREYLDLSLRTRFAQPVMDIWSGDAA
jgi:site-specific DNA-methyltransferase (cytosine-N4-specific)